MVRLSSQRDPGLLSIAGFAEATGISPARLRKWHAHGHLAPARVEQPSGYRQYARAQVRPARLIAALVAAGLPVKEAARCVHEEDVVGVRELLSGLRRGLDAADDIVSGGAWWLDEGAERLVETDVRAVELAACAVWVREVVLPTHGVIDSLRRLRAAHAQSWRVAQPWWEGDSADGPAVLWHEPTYGAARLSASVLLPAAPGKPICGVTRLGWRLEQRPRVRALVAEVVDLATADLETVHCAHRSLGAIVTQRADAAVYQQVWQLYSVPMSRLWIARAGSVASQP